MPDWLTHTIAGWITAKVWKKIVSLVVVGSLLPDLIKIQLIFDVMKINTYGFFDPLHTPVGTLLVALFIATLFPNIKEAFILLTMGASTHYFLDFFLEHPYGGMKLLFPFSWNEYQVHLISSDNYWMTVIAIAVGSIFYLVERKKRKAEKEAM